MQWTKLTLAQAIVLAVGVAALTALLLFGKKMGLDGDTVRGTVAILGPLLTAVAYFFKSPMTSKPPVLPPGDES